MPISREQGTKIDGYMVGKESYYFGNTYTDKDNVNSFLFDLYEFLRVKRCRTSIRLLTRSFMRWIEDKLIQNGDENYLNYSSMRMRVKMAMQVLLRLGYVEKKIDYVFVVDRDKHTPEQVLANFYSKNPVKGMGNPIMHYWANNSIPIEDVKEALFTKARKRILSIEKNIKKKREKADPNRILKRRRLRKLTSEDIVYIHYNPDNLSNKALANIFNITAPYADLIRNCKRSYFRKGWKHAEIIESPYCIENKNAIIQSVRDKIKKEGKYSLQ